MEHGGKLTVLHVLVPFYLPADVPFGMPPIGDLISEHRQQLERLVTKALGPNRPPVTVRVESGDASQRIIEPAAAPTASSWRLPGAPASRISSSGALPRRSCGTPPSRC